MESTLLLDISITWLLTLLVHVTYFLNSTQASWCCLAGCFSVLVFLADISLRDFRAVRIRTTSYWKNNIAIKEAYRKKILTIFAHIALSTIFPACTALLTGTTAGFIASLLSSLGGFIAYCFLFLGRAVRIGHARH